MQEPVEEEVAHDQLDAAAAAITEQEPNEEETAYEQLEAAAVAEQEPLEEELHRQATQHFHASP